MTLPGGDESSKSGDRSQETVTLSLPAEFFQILSDEFEHVMRLLESQQTALREAESARQSESGSEQNADVTADAGAVGKDAPDVDRLQQLVQELLGRDIDSLLAEQATSRRRAYSIASPELYHTARLLGAQAQHRLERLAVSFDQIAGDPVRRELARRRIERATRKETDVDG